MTRLGVRADRYLAVALAGSLLAVFVVMLRASHPAEPVTLPAALPLPQAAASQPAFAPADPAGAPLPSPSATSPDCVPAPPWVVGAPDRTSTPAPGVMVRSWHGAGHDREPLRVVAVEVATARAHLSVAVPARFGLVLDTPELTRRARAVLGLNGDYFDPGPAGAVPRGVEVRHGAVLFAPAGRTNGVGVDQNGGVHAGSLHVDGAVLATVGGSTRQLQVTSVNTGHPADRGIAVETAFGAAQPRRATWYVRVHRGVAVSSSVRDLGAPTGDDVLLMAPAAERAALAWITTGARVRITTSVRTDDGTALAEALGSSTPILAGSAPLVTCVGTFGTGARPRSVLAWNARRAKLWLITVNCLAPGTSGAGVLGVTYYATADIARRLGASDAVLLDGGHSTTLAIRGDATRSDAPPAAPMRPVTNAFVVVPA
ncbi:MAG TPA: phosphodiester glycosidase family protein [Kineosporiaceae bacterium]